MSNALAKTDIPIQENGMVKFTHFGQMIQYAECAIQSGMVPSCFKNPQSVVMAIQCGAELGFTTLQSLRSFFVVNNKPTLYGDAAIALVSARGVLEIFEEWIEGSGMDMTAICKVKRKGLDSIRIDKFSMADAKQAGIIKNNWITYPKDQLKFKARSRALRALFADILCGLPIYEDVRDNPPEPERKSFSNPNPIVDPLIESIPQIGPGMSYEDQPFASNDSESIADLTPPVGFEMENELAEESTQIPAVDTSKPAGALCVEGPIIITPPLPKEKRREADKAKDLPLVVVCDGVRLAIWESRDPVQVKQLREWWAKGVRQFRIDYTSEVKGKYTNNYIVNLEPLEK